MERKRADSFGTFLEQVKRHNVEQAAQQSRRQPDGDEKPGNVLLRILSGSGPLSVSELMRQTGLGFSQFAEALKSIEQADLVSLEGASGDEIVRLTERGQRVAELSS